MEAEDRPRYAHVGYEQLTGGLAAAAAGAISVIVAVALGALDSFAVPSAAVGTSLGFALGLGLIASEITRAPTVRVPAEVSARSLGVRAVAGGVLAVLFGVGIAAIDSSVGLYFGSMFVVGGLFFSIGLAFWVGRFERRAGVIVYRRLGWRWRDRYVLHSDEEDPHRKDTAPAQRKLAHAEPPPARRAP